MGSKSNYNIHFHVKGPGVDLWPQNSKIAENLAKNFYIEGKALKEVYMVICGLSIYLRQALYMTGAGVDLWPQKSKMAEIFNEKIILRGLNLIYTIK